MKQIYLQGVPLIGQPTGETCWLTAAEMVWQYFEQGPGYAIVTQGAPAFNVVKEIKNYQVSDIGKADGEFLFELVTKQQGLSPDEDKIKKLKFYGLSKVKPPSGTWDTLMLYNLVAYYGPLWAGGQWGFGFKHAVAIVGVDLQSGRTFFNNPLPIGKGSVEYWEESTMQGRLAQNGTVAAFTNTTLDASEIGKAKDPVLRFPMVQPLPVNITKAA